MAVTAKTTSLDAAKLRADFPIFEQEFHGKPLAYLDSAVSSQKPRQVLDAMTSFYETSYTNVHRGVYALSERLRQRAGRARDRLRPQRHRSAQPRGVLVGPQQPRPR